MFAHVPPSQKNQQKPDYPKVISPDFPGQWVKSDFTVCPNFKSQLHMFNIYNRKSCWMEATQRKAKHELWIVTREQEMCCVCILQRTQPTLCTKNCVLHGLCECHKWDGQAYRRCPVALLTGLTLFYTEKAERQGILGYAVPQRWHLVQPLNLGKKSLKWDSLAQPSKDAAFELIQSSGSWRIKCHKS